ncbi:hypothetical protein [Fulvimarina sp. MAC8]|uniref:hypothetical protein n=1 Tax=Fulvimarina sp. MAC8 TaxID=3162874 RepID=UPI0032F07ECD
MKGEPAKAFAAIKPLRDVARGGDERLPGRLLFGVSGLHRVGNEVQALRIATTLAKGQGRPAWVSSANSRWIVDRLITDLTDFMDQGPSPYLCGGVENYIATLRNYLDQVSTGGGRSLEEVRAAQADRTRDSIEMARTVMQPVPTPRYAPDLRPIAVVTPALESHPSFTLRRGFDDMRLMLPVATIKQSSWDKTVYGPRIDPGLPLKSRTEMPLDTVQDRLAAIDALMAAAVEGDFLVKIAVRTPTGDEDSLKDYRPVLSRLEDLRPILFGDDARIADPLVRRTLVAAMSEIEILDYLAHAARDDADPLLAAIETTFDAILEARERALAKASG